MLWSLTSAAIKDLWYALAFVDFDLSLFVSTKFDLIAKRVVIHSVNSQF